MHKIRVFFSRVRTMSFRRMVLYAKLARAQRKRPLLYILLDMCICSVRYGVGYLDYYSFGFIHQNAAARRTYMTMADNVALVRRLNDPDYKYIFDDKAEFLAKYPEYVKRDWLDLRKADLEEFTAFAAKYPVFFAKETDNFGGLGVKRIDTDGMDLSALYSDLYEKKMYCLEQPVIQHEQMNALCPSSVNTIRMVTVLRDGKAELMYSIIRMGNGSGAVDNISSGGMYSPVNEEGVLTAPAFCDKTGMYYDTHPATGTPLVGYRIPMFDQAVAAVKQAALIVPQVRYVGWDVAIAPDGPVFIEGNTFPSYDMVQNYGHLGAEKTGIKPRFEKLAGIKF